LREEGVIGRYVLILNPRLLDCEGAVLYLESRASASIARAIPKLKLIDGVIMLLSVHEAGLLLSIRYQSESALTRQVALIESICDAKATMRWTVPYPQFPGKLSRTDWIIIQALRNDPRRKLSDLARDLGISSRTIDRRTKRLSDGKAFVMQLEFDLSRIDGLRYLLLVHCEDRARKKEADETIQTDLRGVVYAETFAPNHSIFVFQCQNISEADNISSWAKGINGLSDMKLGIIKSLAYSFDWVDEEIQRRIASF